MSIFQRVFGLKSSQRQAPQGFNKVLILEPILTPSNLTGLDFDFDSGADLIEGFEFADDSEIEIAEDFLPPDLDNGEEFSTRETSLVSSTDDLEIIDYFDPDGDLDLEGLSNIHGDQFAVKPEFTGGVFTVGESGKVEFDFLFDGGKYKGELGIFRLEGMEGLEPGSEEFIAEAASRALSGSTDGHIVISDITEGAKFSGDLGEPQDWNSGQYLENKSAFTMNPGDEFGLIFVPNGTIEKVADDPDIGGSQRPLFSMSTANPDDMFHVGQIADVTGDGSTFVMEDMRVDSGSDGDYNDFIFQVRGAEGQALEVDDLLENFDWRGNDLGEEILGYAQESLQDYQETLTDASGDLLTDLDDALTDAIADDPAPNDEVFSDLDEVENAFENELQPELDRLDAELDRMTEEILNSVDDGITDTDTLLQDVPEQFISDLEKVFGELAEEPAIYEPISIAPDRFEFAPENQAFVGIIDTGFAGDDADINYSQIITGRDRVAGDDDPFLQVGENNHHGTKILKTIDGINDDTPLWLGRAVGSGRWAESLVEFVDAAIASEQPNAIANLSFDLTQVNADGGIETRLELTESERTALEYARANNVLVVAASGNQNGAMSALAAASQEFDNIIAVGAAEGSDRANYSSYGEGLDLLASGAGGENGASGTSIAAARVTGALSLIWAANPDLSYAQVKELAKSTAKDLNEPGWDAETGAGLLDANAAIGAAKATKAVQTEAKTVTKPTFESAEQTGERQAWSNPFKKLRDSFRKQINTVKRRVASTITQKIKKGLGNLVNRSKTSVRNYFNRAKTNIGNFINKVKTGVTNIGNSIRKRFPSRIKRIEPIKLIRNNFSNITNSISNSLKEILEKARQAAKNAIGDPAFNPASFSGWVGPSIGVALRNSPQHEDRSGLAEPYKKTLYFDGWKYGEVVRDLWTNQSDALWYSYHRNGKQYWVPSAYIYGYPSPKPPLLPSSPTNPGTGSPTKQGFVNGNVGNIALNFRSSPYVQTNNKISSLAKGSTMTILEKVTGGTYSGRNDWYKVKVGNTIGYVAAYYVTVQSTGNNNPNIQYYNDSQTDYHTKLNALSDFEEMARLMLGNVYFTATGGYLHDYSHLTQYYYGYKAFHAGFDIGTNNGNSAYALVGGTVERVTDLGAYVYNSTLDKTIFYGHVINKSLYVGQQISAGTKLGTITDGHLHFHVRAGRNSTWVNPRGQEYSKTNGAMVKASVKSQTLNPLNVFLEAKAKGLTK